MHPLLQIRENLSVYNAGLPHFPRNFTRDAVISALIASDATMMRDQLLFSASKQGVASNPYTGEEPGKIFHEYPGVEINGLSTLFNGCDTTALFIIGHAHYLDWSGDAAFIKQQKPALQKAVDYILAHLKDHLFCEDPQPSGHDKFALKVTYWKDSAILDRPNGEPQYPVAYTLAHIKNLAAIRAAARLLNSAELAKVAKAMAEAVHRLFDTAQGTFYLAIDAAGPISGLSSDALHALYYLEPGDLTAAELSSIVKTSVALETPAGYRTISVLDAQRMDDPYHSRTVWPFEQAIIHAGAIKFQLPQVQEISRRVVKYLESDHEILILDEDKIMPGGCNPQLWTMAAKHYFQHQHQ